MQPARLLSALLALNRIAFGANYLARPQPAGPWGSGRRAAPPPGGQLMTRARAPRAGGRGVGALGAPARGREGEARRWMTAHAVADGVDTAVTFAVRKRLPNDGTTA